MTNSVTDSVDKIIGIRETTSQLNNIIEQTFLSNFNYTRNNSEVGTYAVLPFFLYITNIVYVYLIIIIIMVIFKCYFSGELIALS